MKNTLLALLGFMLVSTPLAATAQYEYGGFYYDSDGSEITITGYTGGGGDVSIPRYLYDEANGSPRPVKHIGVGAFYSQTNVINVTIHDSVTSIGEDAFARCTSLTAITVDAGNPNYASLDGVLFNKNQTTLIQFPGGKAGSYPVPGGVKTIGYEAFSYCTSLSNVTIPISVSYIEDSAFIACTSLKGVFFKGNPPGFRYFVFVGANNTTVYYLPGTTGWGTTFADRPTRLWNPLMQTSRPGFGVGQGGFGFNITGTADVPIVVEGCTNLGNASWVALQSLRLTNGAVYFSDADWTNYPARVYRIRSP
jgi:hypothetical protein